MTKEEETYAVMLYLQEIVVKICRYLHSNIKYLGEEDVYQIAKTIDCLEYLSEEILEGSK